MLRRPFVIAAIVAVATVASIGGLDGAPGDGQSESGHSDGFLVASPDDDRSPESTTTIKPVNEPAESTTTSSPPLPTTARTEAEVGDGSEIAVVAPPRCVPNAEGGSVWRLVFHDDFDGQNVDGADWYQYDSPGNAGFGLRRPSAIAIDEGVLVITAEMQAGQLVSGGMAHTYEQTYGRWEFRVRTEPDPSGATSGVVLTWPESDNWPIDGENDIYETERNPTRTPFRTYIHYGADNSQEFMTHDADGTEWHEMAMDWSPNRIAIYRDGTFVGEVTDPAVIPHVPHHMTVQLDAWAETMGDPVRMYVDWVRVYELDATTAVC